MSFEYLLILTALTAVTFFLQSYYKIRLFKNSKSFLTFSTIIGTVGMVWDNFAVYRGHWMYPGKGIIGIFLGLIPIEDYLFIGVTAYFILTIYKIAEGRK